MERVIWLCNLFLKCEIQILCSNWNPLRFQEKLSHFQHSLSPFISFPPKFANSIAIICSWLRALLEKNTFFSFDVQIWSTSSLTLCLLLLGSFTMVQKLSISFFSTLKIIFPKSLSTKTRSPAPKKNVWENMITRKQNKISNFGHRVSFSIMEKYLRDLIFLSQVNEG